MCETNPGTTRAFGHLAAILPTLDDYGVRPAPTEPKIEVPLEGGRGQFGMGTPQCGSGLGPKVVAVQPQ